MKRSIKITCMTFLVIFSGVSFSGGGGGMTGGSTEITQILNNGELMLQVNEATTQTVAQLNQLARMQQMLTNLPQTVLSEMGISPQTAGSLVKTVQTVSQAYRTVSSLNANLQAFGSQVQNIDRLANLNGMQMSSYLTSEMQRFSATGKGLDAESGVERQTVDRIMEDYQAANRIMQEVPQTQGMKDTTQLMTSSVARLIGSVNNVGMLAASQQRLQTDKAKVELEKDITSTSAILEMNMRRENARLKRNDFIVPWQGK